MNPSTISENRRMMALLSAYLAHRPAFITPPMIDQVVACGVSQDEAYAMLMAESCGVDPFGEREFFNTYFRFMPRRLDPAKYVSDPYRKHIRFPESVCGKYRLTQLSYAAYEAFVCGDISMDTQGREHVPVGYFDRPFIYPALTQNGRIWMTVTPLEIETMRPHIDLARGKIAVMGLGLGYYAFMASMKSEVSEITIVELSGEVISLFERYLLPQFPHGEKIRIIRGDAFDFLQSELARGGFDYVFCDLWHDAADGMEMFLRLKEMERLSPATEFSYWIEDTMKCYLANV